MLDQTTIDKLSNILRVVLVVNIILAIAALGNLAFTTSKIRRLTERVTQLEQTGAADAGSPR